MLTNVSNVHAASIFRMGSTDFSPILCIPPTGLHNVISQTTIISRLLVLDSKTSDFIDGKVVKPLRLTVLSAVVTMFTTCFKVRVHDFLYAWCLVLLTESHCF